MLICGTHSLDVTKYVTDNKITDEQVLKILAEPIDNLIPNYKSGKKTKAKKDNKEKRKKRKEAKAKKKEELKKKRDEEAGK